MSTEIDKPYENCGVSGIIDFNGRDVIRRAISSHNLIQHRGFDAAGFATLNKGFHLFKGLGSIKQLFTEQTVIERGLEGPLAIGHNRYRIQGGDTLSFAQPIIAAYRGRKIAVAHNGNVPELDTHRSHLASLGIQLNPDFDSNILAHLIVAAEGDSWIKKIQNGLREVEGSYSLTIATDDGHLIGVRDPWGNRPLSWARLSRGAIIASETAPSHVLDAQDWTEFRPGQVIDISADGIFTSSLPVKAAVAHCVFENIYLADSASIMDGGTNSSFREGLGEMLAERHQGAGKIVTSVPESGDDAAMAYAHKTKKKQKPIIRKVVSAISRSFMSGEIDERQQVAETKFKLSPDAKDQEIDIIDDSIVIGITSKVTTYNLLARIFAKLLHLRSTAPKIVKDCPWGVNMRSGIGRFIALDPESGRIRTNEEIAEEIGVTTVDYNTIEDLKDVMLRTGRNPENYCYHCFGGQGIKRSQKLDELSPIERIS